MELHTIATLSREWLKNRDTSPVTRDVLENKKLRPNIDFSRRLIKQLENEKRQVKSALQAAGIDIEPKELPADSPEANKTEVQPNESVLSNKLPSSSLPVLSSDIEPGPVLTAVSEEMPLPQSLAPTFFSSASPSASHSSSSASSFFRSEFLSQDGIWQRCLELRALIGFVADPTDIEESSLLNAGEAKQKYVNIISFVEDQIGHSNQLSSDHVALIQRALAPMMENRILSRDGQVVDRVDIELLFQEVGEFSAEAEGEVKNEMEEEVAAPIPNALSSSLAMHARSERTMPEPRSTSSSLLSSLYPSSHSERTMPLPPSFAIPLPVSRSQRTMPASTSASSSLSSSFYHSSDEAIRLSKGDDVWQRCLELKELLSLPLDKGRTETFFSRKKMREQYVGIISWIEEKNGRAMARLFMRMHA